MKPPSLLNFQLNLTEEAPKETQSQPSINADNLLLNPEELKSKSSALLNSLNDPIKEKSFRQTCSFYSEHSIVSLELYEAYQEYVKSYNKITSLYLFDISWRYKYFDIDESVEKLSNLFIYNTESEKEEMVVVKTPEVLNSETCITQLPNGELFCLDGSSTSLSEIAFIINSDYKARRLPSYTSYYASPLTYFNRSIYCFGGYVNDCYKVALSRRFDLDRNRWNILTPLPKADAWCYSAVFNGNILISGRWNSNLLIYSVDIDSYSTVPYDFGYYKQKIVVNADERLYYIQFKGLIYESTDAYTWERISESGIDIWCNNMYWVYNKGGIYIGIMGNEDMDRELFAVDTRPHYYKFDLDKKALIKLNRSLESSEFSEDD